MIVWRAINEGLNAVIVNPSVIVGPGNWHRSSGQLIQVVWKGLKYYIEGMTGYVDVRDVVKVMIHLMNGDYSGERYIITSENLTNKEVLEMIAGALGKPLPSRVPSPIIIQIVCVLDWFKSLFSGDKRRITMEFISAANEKRKFSNEKIIKVTGIRFIPVHESIQETARLFLQDVSS